MSIGILIPFPLSLPLFEGTERIYAWRVVRPKLRTWRVKVSETGTWFVNSLMHVTRDLSCAICGTRELFVAILRENQQFPSDSVYIKTPKLLLSCTERGWLSCLYLKITCLCLKGVVSRRILPFWTKKATIPLFIYKTILQGKGKHWYMFLNMYQKNYLLEREWPLNTVTNKRSMILARRKKPVANFTSWPEQQCDQFPVEVNRPLALRSHMTNPPLKQWVGIPLLPKIDRAHQNCLTCQIWE